MRNNIFILLLAIPFLGNQTYKNYERPRRDTLPFFKKTTMDPTWKTDKKNIIQLDDFKLESHLKEDFSSNDIKGKVSIVSFFFATCPGYCPRMTQNIKRVFKQYMNNKEVSFISFSVTPQIDTVKILNEYANKNGINNKNWQLVRGDRKVIYDIARNQLFSDLTVDLSKNEDQFAHSESLYLLDQEMNLRGIYNSASKRALGELIEDIKKLQ